MNKTEAVKRFTEYLKVHNIYFELSIDHGTPLFTMVYDVENAPGRCVEGCIWWNEDFAEVRVYYNTLGKSICEKSECINELLRLLNFVNARVFLSCGHWDGLYEPHLLYTPRIYLTEDGEFDITITTIVNYDFYEVAPVETEEYITAYCPELLDRLSPAIFGVLLEQLTFDQGRQYIEERILEDKEL